MLKKSNIPISIQKSLLGKLSKARKNIKLNKDLYLDSEHEKLCEYYNKYNELYKKFNSHKLDIKYYYIKIDKHILSNSHDIKYILTFKNKIINFDLLYNKYNKKFINRLYVLHDNDYYNEWIKEQNKFIKKLTPEEIYSLKCYTHDGDIIINYYINNNFNIDKNIDEIDNGYRKSKIVVNKNIVNTNRNFILFYYQIKEYLYNKDLIFFSKLNRLELEEYIISNYINFDWDTILLLYIKDIDNIFKKCPTLKKNLVFYRGVNDEYYLKNSHKGIYISKTLTSFTLNYKIAIVYAARNCCIMRIIAPEFSKIILLDIISPYNEREVIIPFDTKYIIDYPRHKIKYYKTGEICPDDSKAKNMIVTDLSIIPKRNSKSNSKSKN